MDLLRYSDIVQQVCFREKSRREAHDILRQLAVYPERMRVCPCVQDPWIRKSLGFLNARIDNEASCQRPGPEPNRELLAATKE
jgi:hypothetical protein